MSETSIPAVPSVGQEHPYQHRHRRVAMFVIAGLILAALVAVFATGSFSQGYGPAAGEGPGFGMHWGFHRGAPGFWRGGPFSDAADPAWIENRADRMVRHLAVELNASAEQQDKLSTIVKGAVKDIAPLREKMLVVRQQGRDLLTAATVDRAALEKLRADQLATRDLASKRFVQALADAAEVLTPDQRKQLKELLPPAGLGGWGPMGGWGRGMGGPWNRL